MRFLSELGLSAFFIAQLTPEELESLPVARVAATAHGHYTLLTATGPRPGSLAGRARGAGDLPTVGDWVVVEGEDALRIVRTLERASAFRRRGPDGASQVIAANVDTVFVVTAVGADYSVRRVERYLAALASSGASPVVVLTKVDLVPDPLPRVRALERVLGTIPVVACSVVTGEGCAGLRDFVGPHRTAAFTGSSGVGKSTLVNWLCGEPRQDTGGIRLHDETGKHTTTARTLVPLPGGGLLLDTPGMRAFALEGDADLEAVYAEVAAAAAACRYRDCQHGNEPGCAVQAGIAAGVIDSARLAAWRKLEREAAFAVRRDDPAAVRKEQARWKRIQQDSRAREALRRRNR